MDGRDEPSETENGREVPWRPGMSVLHAVAEPVVGERLQIVSTRIGQGVSLRTNIGGLSSGSLSGAAGVTCRDVTVAFASRPLVACEPPRQHPRAPRSMTLRPRRAP